jgi:hypothetical protein
MTGRGAWRATARFLLAAGGAALVLAGGWALAASVTNSADPRAMHVHGVPLGLAAVIAIVAGGLLLALFVLTRRAA